MNENTKKELLLEDLHYFSFVTISGDVHIIPFQPHYDRKHIANQGCWCSPFCEDKQESDNLHMYKHHAIQ